MAWLLVPIGLGAWLLNHEITQGPEFYSGEEILIATALLLAPVLLVATMALGLIMWLWRGRRDVLIAADSMLLASCLLLPLESFLLIFALPDWIPDEARFVIAMALPGAMTLAMLLTVVADRPKPSGTRPPMLMPPGQWIAVQRGAPGNPGLAPSPLPPEDRP
jgi:hypothetical protein